MNFRKILQEVNPERNQDIVAMGIYFCTEILERGTIDTKKLYQFLSENNTTVPRRHISTYIQRLKKEGKVKETDNGEYCISFDYLGEYEEMVTAASNGVIRNGDFIEIEADSDFYQSLIENINKCYREGINDATLILSRKLLENLVLDILRRRYGLRDEKKQLFYNTKDGYLLGFSRLLDNLEENLDEDFSYWSDRLDSDLIARVRCLKGRGDAGAHSIEINVSESDIEEYRDNINSVVEVLFYVREEIGSSSRTAAN